MKTYKETLEILADTIIANDFATSRAITKSDEEKKLRKRFNVYSDGYKIRLSGAVKVDYPTFCYYIGGQSEGLIAEFVTQVKSRSYTLDKYPESFADWVSKKNISPEAKELAKLEAGILKVFAAPDSPALTGIEMQKKIEAGFEELKVNLRLASTMLEFEFEVERYLADFRTGKKPKKLKRQRNFMLICRHENEVKRHQLDECEFLLLVKLGTGLSFGEAVSELISQHPQAEAEMTTNFQNWLQKWLVDGFFTE